MAAFTVLEPPDTTSGSLAAADESRFIRDGFSLAAFLFTPIWLLAHRLWLAFLIWLALMVAVSLIVFITGAPPELASIASLVVSLFIGFEGRDLQRAKWAGAGWRFAGVAAGRNLDEAEIGWFSRRAIAEGAPITPTQTPRQVAASILGVFPEPVAGARG